MRQVVTLLDEWFKKPVIPNYIAKQNATKQALEAYVVRREKAAIDEYRRELQIENDNNAVLIHKGLGAPMSAFDKQRKLQTLETNAEKQVYNDKRRLEYSIKKKTKKAFTSNKLLIDLLFQLVNCEPNMFTITWIDIRNSITNYFETRVLVTETLEPIRAKEQWLAITNQSSISTTLKYAYILTCIERYATPQVVLRLAAAYECAEIKASCWNSPTIKDVLPNIAHREYLLEWFYFHSIQQYPTTEKRHTRKRIKCTPSGTKMPTSTPLTRICQMVRSCLIGVYKTGTEFIPPNDKEFFELLSQDARKVFIGVPCSYTGIHKNNPVEITGRWCELRLDILSFLALLFHQNILLPPNNPITLEIIIWIDNQPCLNSSLMKGAWKIINNPKLFQKGFDTIVESVHSFMWFWAPEISSNIEHLFKYLIPQCDRLKSAICFQQYAITSIPRILSGDYGMFAKVVGCNNSTCPCCGVSLRDQNIKFDYLALRKRKCNTLEDIFNFNKDETYKNHGYTNKCLIAGGDWDTPWNQRSLRHLERAEDPLHIIETILSDIVQHLFDCTMFDKDQFYIYCGEVLHRNNVSKSGMSSSDWRLLFLQYKQTVLRAFKQRILNSPDDNSIQVICELLKYILQGMYVSEEHRTPQVIVSFAVAAFQLPIYLCTRVGESIMRVHLHTLWLHVAKLFTRIALRTVSSDAFERSNHDTKYRAQFSNHKPETAIIEDKVRAHEELITQISHSITKRTSESKIDKTVQHLEYPNIVLRAELIEHEVFGAWVTEFLNDEVLQKYDNFVSYTVSESGSYVFNTALSVTDKQAPQPLLNIGPALLTQSVQARRIASECSTANCHDRRVSTSCVFHQCKACCLAHNCCISEQIGTTDTCRIIKECIFHKPSRSASKPTTTPIELRRQESDVSIVTLPPNVHPSQVSGYVPVTWETTEPLPSLQQLGSFFSQQL